MKHSCNIVKDLLPLYADDVCSDDTKKLVEEHFEECPSCRTEYQKMKAPLASDDATNMESYRTSEADSIVKVRKKWKKSQKILLIAGICIGALIVQFLAVIAIALGLFSVSTKTGARVEACSIDDYDRCLGENSDATYGHKLKDSWAIFPESPATRGTLYNFNYIYYNPWDPQTLTCCSVTYSDEEYANELARLSTIGTESYTGIYSVTGAPQGYKLLAMAADEYYGFVYAMVPEDTASPANTVTYVGIEFCNFFCDLNVKNYIPEEYLLEGLNVTQGNPYRKKMMKENF